MLYSSDTLTSCSGFEGYKASDNLSLDALGNAAMELLERFLV